MTNDHLIASWAIASVWFLMASMIILHSMTPRGEK